MSEAPEPTAEDEDEPFNRFMVFVLNLYHTEHVTAPSELAERANAYLAELPLPELADGEARETNAQALIERADKGPSEDGKQSLRWVVDALALWPDCAEAYMFIARISEGRQDAVILLQPFYALAAEALRHRLAPLGIAGPDGQIRDVAEAGMYLRTLCGLGEALATVGKFSEAQTSYIEALTLDPEDGEDVRPRLALVEMLLGEFDEAAARIESARPGLITAYVKAFVALARSGDGPAARQALAVARGMNPHLFPMLTLAKPMPGTLTEDEVFDAAQFACLALAPAFVGRTGIRDWLKHVASAGHPPSSRGSHSAKKKRRR
jgi:tetratricopeptide (TPR) repeat protein